MIRDVLEPPDIDLMFRAGTPYRWDDGAQSVIDVQPVGTLHLLTGRLIAQDPTWGAHPAIHPFTVAVPPGRYPVTLSISHWDRPPHPGDPCPMRLVNAAKLAVRDEPASSWELALRPGEETASLEDDSFFGFSVDCGAGSFFDASFRDHLERLPLAEAVFEVIDLGGVEVSGEDPESNIIVFRCGMGDGVYPTWIGRAKNGEVTCFVTDLELLHHSLGPDNGP